MSSNSRNSLGVSKFKSVRKDRNFNSVKTVKRDKIPQYRGFSSFAVPPTPDQIGNEPGMEGDIIVDRITGNFCWHDGKNWRCTGDFVTITNLCTDGESLVVGDIGPDLSIKGLEAGAGISLSSDGSCVTIINTGAPGPTGPPGPQGDTGAQGPTGADGNDGAQGPTGAPGPTGPPGDDVTLTNLCTDGESLVVDGTGPTLSVKGLIKGSGINLISGASCVTITTNLTDSDLPPGVVTGLDNLCTTGESLVVGNIGPDLSIKGLEAGSGISLSSDGSCVTIINTGAPGPTGADGTDGAPGPTGPTGAEGTDGAPGPTGPTGADGTDGAPGPTGPTGADGNDGAQGPTGSDGAPGPTGADGAPGPTGPPGDDVTLTNLCGTGVSLVVNGTGPDLTVRGLIAGSGIDLTSDASCVTIATSTSGTASNMFFFSSDGALPSGTTWIGLGTESGTFTNVSTIMACGGTITSMTGKLTDPPAGKTVTLELAKNGTLTGLILTYIDATGPDLSWTVVPIAGEGTITYCKSVSSTGVSLTECDMIAIESTAGAAVDNGGATLKFMTD